MKAPNINDLDLDTMLEQAEITVGVLRVIHALHHVEDYEKENAAQDLIKVLHERRYLDDPLEVRKGEG